VGQKQFLGNIIHLITKLITKGIVVSSNEAKQFLAKSLEVKLQIENWAGKDAFEVISLGQNCNSSWYIKAAGVKRASFPFDWIYTTAPIISDILKDDFKNLLDRKFIIPHGMDAGHELYHETLFGHRNPVKSDSDYAYYERCVERWREKMRQQAPIVFVTIVLNEPEKRPRFKKGFTKQIPFLGNQSFSDFEGMMNTILDSNPNCKFLFIEQYTEFPFHLEVEHQTKNALWVRFDAIGRNTGVRYVSEIDEAVILNLFSGLDYSADQSNLG